MSFKSKMAAFIAGLSILSASGDAYARKNLQLRYETHKSVILKDTEVALKIPIKRGISYSVIAQIYTGNENNATKIMLFNDNKKLFFIKNKPMEVFVPRNLLSDGLKRILDENKFVSYEIGSAEEDGDETVSNLWEIAGQFMTEDLDMGTKINILFALNDEVNPLNGVVYPGQKIIVPESLIDYDSMQGNAPKKTDKSMVKPAEANTTKPGVKPKEVEKPKVKPTEVAIQKGKQNPFRTTLSDLLDDLAKKDRYGSARLRTLGRGKFRASKHKGIDLVAPIGTPLYPVEAGVIISAGKVKGKFWRNGIVVEYKTNSGIVLKYCHLSSIPKGIKPGVNITLGTVLGYVGITGNASKNYPHVHIGAKKDGKVINPTSYVLVDTAR